MGGRIRHPVVIGLGVDCKAKQLHVHTLNWDALCTICRGCDHFLTQPAYGLERNSRPRKWTYGLVPVSEPIASTLFPRGPKDTQIGYGRLIFRYSSEVPILTINTNCVSNEKSTN